MTDSDYFDYKVKAFLHFCWGRKALFLIVLLISSIPIYFAISYSQKEKYLSTIRFAKVDYDLWAANFYTLKAANIYLKNNAKVGGGEDGAQPHDKSNGATSATDTSDEALETPDDFAEMLLAQVPRAHIVSGVAEVELVTEDPEFIDKVFYPMVTIARQMYIDERHERQNRIIQIYDDVARGNLSQKQRETIDENLINLKVAGIVGETDMLSAIDTQEMAKNELVERSIFRRLGWTFVLSLLLSAGGFLTYFVAKETYAAYLARTAPKTS